MKTLSKNLKNKTAKVAFAIALVLVFAIVVSLLAVPTVSGQNEWSLYITTRFRDGRVRAEVRLDGSRQRYTFTGGILRFKAPGDTDWTELGPYDAYSGRFTYYYSFSVQGVYQFQWVMPPQPEENGHAEVPPNPDTADGKYYSDVASMVYGWGVTLEATLSTGRVRGEIQFDDERQSIANTNVTLAAKAPGDTDWTYYGPFSTTDGRVDYTYDFSELGIHTLQYIVEPMNELPENPATPDGYWYSPIVEVESAASIYIEVTPSTGRVRGEVRINGVRQQVPFENVTLRFKAPGDTDWTYLLFNTTDGRVDYMYDFDDDWGVHQFQWIVPPQGPLPTNPDTTDGKWYSRLVEVNYVWSIYISTPEKGYPNTEFTVRGEVHFVQVRQQESFADVMLAVKHPGDTDWTMQGPYDTTNGRIDVDFVSTELGVHQFQWIVPPQGPLPTNPDTTDGKWYSEISETDVVKEIYAAYAFIGAVPNPVGVGQDVLLHLGITQQLALDGMHWEGITVEVTYPDGTLEVLGGADGFSTDSTGGTGTIFVPTMAGNYTLRTHYPEQQTTPDKRAGGSFGAQAVPIGGYMRESYSRNLTLVVTEDPITYYPGHALPDEYWTRPIDAQLREWSAIAGSSFEPEYNDAPESAHVLWAKRLGVEGTIGGTVDTRENYSSRVIISGILLYNTEPMADVTQAYHNASTVAVDVRTGEELWRMENLRIDWGQIYYHDSINRHCAYAYAWTLDEETRTAVAYDPWDGNELYEIRDFPEGPMSLGPIGEMLVYQIDFEQRYMHVWNSSWQYMEGRTGMSQAWNALRTTQQSLPKFGYRRGWQLNITIPDGLTGEIREVVWGERVVGVDFEDGKSREWAFSLEPGKEGTLLWDRNVNYALPSVATVEGPVYVNGSIGDHVQLRYQESTGKYWAFSLDTGTLLWKSEDFDATANGEEALNLECRNEKVAYGMLYTAGAGGTVYAYDLHEGLNWTYSAWDDASEVVEDGFFWSGVALVSDGKVYVAFGEPAQGAPFICLDAMTGEEIWRVDGMFRQTWGGPNVFIGDSVIVTLDTYDTRVYAIGKGPTAITASAPSVSVPFDTPVAVKGRVTDVSPGTWDAGLGTYTQYNVDDKGVTWDSAMKLRFPNGVPAVSDESMGDWMKYVYKNLERPDDVVGVEVVISVLDSNNNYYEVARGVADSNGAYNIEFVPLIPGKYVVYAAFEGSESYFGSVAETTIVVDEELAATPPPTPKPESVVDLYFVPAVSGIVVAIVVLGALLALLILRKR